MSRQGWGECLITAETDSTAMTNTVTATSIIPAAARFTLPANFYDIGKTLRIRAAGRVTMLSAATITFQLNHGTTGLTSVFSGGAITMNTTVKTNVSWWLDLTVTCRSIGSGTTATLMGIGEWNSEAVTGASAGTRGSVNMPAATPAVGGGFDSTVANVVDLMAIWNTASASNSIQTHIYELWADN
jgi:hypothetical protein